ncbi:MAG: glycosyltransferase family 4 protein [Lentisphaerae bacterium]|jgi:glycosyltransferase involved in cell wall biosynthesis|nr:glycosyltransferase family 4 protein [Lentisphaerota bacterium]
MNILLLAPHPFYQERGTPIAVDLLARTLSERGENVDILAYHEGEDRTYPRPGSVRLFRISAPPGCRNIRPGFSFKKLLADIAMHRVAMRMAAAKHYDLVHAVEESVFMAMRIQRRRGIPYVYDMDSSLSQQMADKLWWARPLMPFMRGCERRAVRGAKAVTAVCDSLADQARGDGARHIAILRDVPLLEPLEADGPARGFRHDLGLDGPALLYIGNLESYQGIDLLLEAFARVPANTGAHLVIIGGILKHVAQYQAKAQSLGLADRVHLPGPRPIPDMAALMADTDILVSPRIHGTNTPMKIYSYMASGKAILATDLPTHTQVLDAETARLAPPRPTEFGQAMTELIQQPETRAQLGAAARHAVETRYSLTVYRQTLNELYDYLAADK